MAPFPHDVGHWDKHLGNQHFFLKVREGKRQFHVKSRALPPNNSIQINVLLGNEELRWLKTHNPPAFNLFMNANWLCGFTQDSSTQKVLYSSQRDDLKIQSLRGSLLLFIENILFRLFEIFICYFHSPFPQSHQSSFCTNCLQHRKQEQLHFLCNPFKPHRETAASSYCSSSCVSERCVNKIYILKFDTVL